MFPKARMIKCNIRASTIVLLILWSFVFSPPVFAAQLDYAKVSPGKIPPKTPPGPKDWTQEMPGSDQYLGNSSYLVKLEYPRSFILQQTVGDLLFNLTLNVNVISGRHSIDIYVPPEFQLSTNRTYVWSTITNDYSRITVTRQPSYDLIAPNWYRVSVTNGTSITCPTNNLIRIFSVTAPGVVGRYFFKVFTDGTSIGSDNFPSVVVSADPDPAYVSGTIRYGGRLNATYYDSPVSLLMRDEALKHGFTPANKGQLRDGGKVFATGTTPDGRTVVGQAFFNSNNSEYTLYGLAPGRYHLNATAAGYAWVDLPYDISLRAASR